MPIYEFRCQTCAHVFELLCRTGTEACGLECPKCAGAVARKFSMFRTGRSEGDTTPRSGSGGGCSTCSGGSCSTCGVL